MAKLVWAEIYEQGSNLQQDRVRIVSRPTKDLIIYYANRKDSYIRLRLAKACIQISELLYLVFRAPRVCTLSPIRARPRTLQVYAQVAESHSPCVPD